MYVDRYYKTPNIAKCAYLVLYKHEIAKLEQDGNRIIFCFYPDAALAARDYELNASVPVKDYHEAMQHVRSIVRAGKLNELKTSRGNDYK